MSSPSDPQPFGSPGPQRGQQPMTAQPSSSQQFRQPLQGPSPELYWQPATPAPKPSNGLAITALVVASVALLTGLGGFVSQIFMGALFGGLASSGGGYSPSASSMPGTAPQVVAGQAYSGALLQDEVARVIRADGGDVKSISCPATPVVVATAVTVCQGVVDGSGWTFRLTFEDLLGHFTLEQKVS
jgi:hypothetical protein